MQIFQIKKQKMLNKSYNGYLQDMPIKNFYVTIRNFLKL